MKSFLIFLLLATSLLGAESKNDNLLLWSLSMNSPERWKSNSSGDLKITRDESNNSVRFDVTFPPTGDRWIYPMFQFIKNRENFADASLLTFEVKAQQSNPTAGYKHSFVMLGGMKIPFLAPPATGEWQNIVIDLKKHHIDYDKTQYIQIGFNPKSPKLVYELRNIRMFGQTSKKEKIDIADAITFSAPGTAFLDNEKITFRLKPEYRVPAQYIVEKWTGECVAKGKIPDWKNGTIELTGLPRGYYRLSVSSEELPFCGTRSFAVIPDLRHKRNYESAYCIDSCLSWFARPNALTHKTRDKESNPRFSGQAYDLGVELCSRLGVSMVRERLSWRETERTKGKFDWKQYLPNVKRFEVQKIKVLELYHDAPEWCLRQPDRKFPMDALEICSYAENVARAMRHAVEFWEYFNEEDLGGPYSSKYGAGAWDYMAGMKAAAYGFEQGAPGVKAINGGLACLPLRAGVETFFKNDYAQYGNILNVHTYLPLKALPEMVTDTRAVLKRNGLENMPIWFTEFGTYLEGAGATDSFLSGLKEHSPEQELVVAEFIPKSNVILQQSGVEKNFLFMLLPYNEGAGRKVWGQLKHDYTVKAGYVAMATMIEQLGDATLLGEMKMPAGVRAFLFRRPGGSQSVILWSISPVETESKHGVGVKDLYPGKIDIPAAGKVMMTDFLGTQTQLAASRGKVSVTYSRFPVYLSGLSGLKADIPPVPVPKFSRNENEYDKSIIMNVFFPRDCEVSSTGEAITIPQDKTSATFQIWNLSDSDKHVELKSKGAKVNGLPEKISLAPKSKQAIPININCGNEIIGDITFSGMAGSKKITRLTIPFKQFHKMTNTGFQEPLPWTMDPKMWSGRFIKSTQFDEKEKAVAIDVAFPQAQHPWVYPEYKLQLPQESLKGSYGISFELKTNTDIKMLLFIMPMNTPNRPGRIAEYTMKSPQKDQWREHIVTFSQGQEPGEVTALRLGMTPKDARNFRLYIRNIKILYRNR